MRRLARGGFSFIELIVALAIMVTIAAVVTPVLVGSLDQARRETTLKILDDVRVAIAEFESDVGDNPGALSQLTTRITGADDNVCGQRYATGPGKGNNEVDRWEGPYLTRAVPATGLPVPVGRASNQLLRSPSSRPDWIILRVDSVAIEDALALNELRDGDGNDEAAATQNAVRWAPFAPGADGLVELAFYMPVGGC